MENTEILAIYGKDYKDMTKKLLEEACLASRIPDKECRIGIKPNLVSPSDPSRGATTHPEIVAGIIEYLQERGFHDLVMLEGSWVGDKTEDTARLCGYYDLSEKYGVDFLDMQKDSYETYDCEGMELKICDEAKKLDFLINVPVTKGHCQTKITCALKNCKGLIPNSEKRRFHTMGLHRPIACLNTIIHQDLILADNICGDLDFEEGGSPVAMNRILAFRDPVLCDSFAAEIMGYEPYDIEYIRLAEELGVGSADTEKARIHALNREAETVKQAAPKGQAAKLAAYVKAKDACSACYGSLIYALNRLDEQGRLNHKKKKSLAIGQGYRKKQGTYGIGNCTSCFRKYAAGCPPKAVDVVRFLEEEWE